MNLQQLMQQLPAANTAHKYPVDQWNPTLCGTMDLRIHANGEWWHEGRPITRRALIDLFAQLLWVEQGQYYLKTPVEKIQIQVDDAPLQIIAVEQQISDDGTTYLYCQTAHGDHLCLNEQHPIEMRTFQGEWRPYVHVRFGLWALVQRAVFYHLIDYGQLQETSQGGTILTLTSGNVQFHLSTPEN
ncbi:MAG: DUF1285 domain-containing protein [Acinetobacter sp.]|nr:DUF1285 domain-containing protein [Acinetobacter sp.]